MLRPWRWLPLVALAGLAALAIWGITRPREDFVRSALIGQTLPPIALPPALPGKPGIGPGTLAPGRPYLINIFASWCVPCRAEAPQLAALRAGGAEIVGIALRDDPADLKRFLAETGDPFRAIGADESGAVQLALGSAGVPETYVIGADGRIVAQHIGDIRPEHVGPLLRQLEVAR